jgi:hypothetical protein
MATARHRIEIYSAGCATCKDTIEMVKRVAGSDHDVHVHEMHHGDTAARAKSLGIRSLPAVVVNGKLASCCAERGPNEQVLREALR